MKNKIIKINSITCNEKLYPREHLSQSTVKEYAKAMKDGDIFPLIEVALLNNKYILVDGRHRLEAMTTNGEEFVNAEIRTNFTNENEIYLASVRANLKHGKKLSDTDKLKIAITLRDMHYDINDVSKLLHINMGKIEKLHNANITRQILNQKLKNNDLKSVITETVPSKEKILIVDKLTEQTEQLENFLWYINTEKLKIENKKIKRLINDIKFKLNKLF